MQFVALPERCAELQVSHWDHCLALYALCNDHPIPLSTNQAKNTIGTTEQAKLAIGSTSDWLATQGAQRSEVRL